MAEISFTDIASNILNDWLVDQEGEEEKVEKEERKTEFNQLNTNEGIGYKEEKKQRIENSLFSERLKKKKKKELTNKKDSDFQITHGIVEEEILSKITNKTNNKRKLNETQQPQQQQEKQEEKQGKETQQQQYQQQRNIDINSIPPLSSITISTDLEHTATTTNTTLESNLDDKTITNQFNSQQINKNSFLDRKKVKTRSKQKNIRRDKRGEEFKPSHLVIGSKDYLGRPLTQVGYKSIQYINISCSLFF